jgi:hypothetical protein
MFESALTPHVRRVNGQAHFHVLAVFFKFIDRLIRRTYTPHYIVS